MGRWLHLICQELNYLLPPGSVHDHGRATDLIERNRRIDAAPFLWTFLIGTPRPTAPSVTFTTSTRSSLVTRVAYSSIQQLISLGFTHHLTGLIGYVRVKLG